MDMWPDQLKRQAIAALNNCASKVAFTGTTAEELWLWQAERRAALKRAMVLELPPVYGPPKAKIIQGDPDRPDRLQTWSIETDPGMTVPLAVQAASTVAALVFHIAQRPDPPSHQKLCEQVSALGLAAAVVALRATDDREPTDSVAELYVGLGGSYAGAAVKDLLRVVDHVESRFQSDTEPLIITATGRMTPMALALAAIDQRVAGLMIDGSDSAVWNGPQGRPPLFLEQYVHLGPNPIMTLAQCCAPRPMTLLNFPTDKPSWLPGTQSPVLSAADQIGTLRETFDVAGHADRLQLGHGCPPDHIKTFLNEHFPATDS